MKIKGIKVLIRKGHTDTVFILTDLPSPFPSAYPDELLKLKFECTKGTGVEYVRQNFGIDPAVIEGD